MARSAGSAMAPNTMVQAVATSRRFNARILVPVLNKCMAFCPSLYTVMTPTLPRLGWVLLLVAGGDLVQVLVEGDVVLPASAVDGVLVAVHRIDEVVALAALDGVLTGVGGGLVAQSPD